MMKATMTYITGEQRQHAAVEQAGAAPISDEPRTKITAAVHMIK